MSSIDLAKQRPREDIAVTAQHPPFCLEPHFDVHGYRFCASGDPDAIRSLASDFQFFQSDSRERVAKIELLRQEPPYDSAGDGIASVYTPRSVSFTTGTETYIDYGGKALALYDRAAGSLRVWSMDQDLLYEAAYLFVLSRCAETLDQRGYHRVHALGLTYNGRAILALLPMGGGKSTLGAALLKKPEFGFLSDDSPLISKDGKVHAFPLRLGLLPGNETGIPPNQIRRIQRMEFGPKMLVSYAYFADRIVPVAEPGLIFLGRRSLSRDCRIEPAGRLEARRAMLTNSVIGLGLFQGMEFVFQSSMTELLSKGGSALSRYRASTRLLGKSQVFRLILGRDSERNAEVVTAFVRERLARRAG